MAELPEELPTGAFLASMPWWVVPGRGDDDADEVDAGEPDAGGIGAGITAGEPPGYLVLDADGSTCLAVFTDEDLAQRFVGDVGFDGGPLPVDTPEQFASLARQLPPVCQYAAFDP